jgi:hypothetical protein
MCGWLHLRVALEALRKKNISRPCREAKEYFPVVTVLTELLQL